MTTSRQSKPKQRHNITLWLVLAIILYFIIAQHWVHIVPYLPWLLVAACPLMHIFMHRGHAHHGHDHGSTSTDDSSSDHKED